MRYETFDRKDVNLVRGIFLMEEMGKCLIVGWDSPPSPSPVFSTKAPWKEGQSTPSGGNKTTLKEGDIFVKKGDTGVLFWETILLDTVLY